MRSTIAFLSLAVLLTSCKKEPTAPEDGTPARHVSVSWTRTAGPGGTEDFARGSNGSLYAGSFGGGVYVSSDNGNTWTAINSGLTIYNRFVRSIVRTGTILLIGTETGVFRCTDDSASWTSANAGLTDSVVHDLAISGADLLAATGHGVFRSTNNGASWTAASSGLTSTSGRCFALSPDNITLYIGMFYGDIFRTTNNGSSWSLIGTVPSASASLQTLLVAGTALFAGTYSSGVYRSTNGGKDWTAVNTGLAQWSLVVLASALSTASGLGTDIFIGTKGGGVLVSTDGATWSAVNAGLTDLEVSALLIVDKTIYAGTPSGIFKGTIQ